MARDGKRLACPRCAAVLRDIQAPPAAAEVEQLPSPEPSPPLTVAEDGPSPPPADAAPAVGTYDPWEVDERLRHIDRLLKSAAGGETESAASPAAPASKSRRSRLRIDGPHRVSRPAPVPEPARLDAAHAGPPEWHAGRAPSRRRRKTRPAAVERPRGQTAIWITLSVGVMLLVCGGMLLGWSLLGGRQELWTAGAPIALAGQIALLVGLLLQLERLWRHSHVTVARLENVDDQLHDLKSTTALLGTTHSSPATAFYSHFAGGASPHLLLTDLKGQLDLLAVKIEQMD